MKLTHKAKLSELLAMHAALRALDGGTKIIRENGADKAVTVSYAIDPATRWTIAGNLVALSPIVEAFNEARNGLVRAAAAGEAKISEEAMPAFTEALNALLEQERPVRLETLTFADLSSKARPNAIPATVIEGLWPLFKQGKKEEADD